MAEPAAAWNMPSCPHRLQRRCFRGARLCTADQADRCRALHHGRRHPECGRQGLRHHADQPAGGQVPSSRKCWNISIGCDGVTARRRCRTCLICFPMPAKVAAQLEIISQSIWLCPVGDPVLPGAGGAVCLCGRPASGRAAGHRRKGRHSHPCPSALMRHSQRASSTCCAAFRF